LNILVNLATLKTGGGQNVAMNFLYAFKEVIQIRPRVSIFFIVARESQSHKYLRDIGYEKYIVAPKNPVQRILFEVFCNAPRLQDIFSKNLRWFLS